MEQCFGCLGILFGSRQRRLRHLVKYKDDASRNLGVEFENLMLDDIDRPNYGTDIPAITQEERDYIAKRDYDRILEEQRKVDEQIGKQLFEEEELLREEEEAYYEAQEEAAKAASATLSLKEKSADLSSLVGSSMSSRSLTLEEVEDDFEDFLEQVRSRSLAFRNQFASRNPDSVDASTRAGADSALPAMNDRGGDGMSSEEEYVLDRQRLKCATHDDVEWDPFTSGLGDSEAAGDSSSQLLEKRLEPVGVGSSPASPALPPEKSGDGEVPPRLTNAERMFSITDEEEDMGEFVRA